MTLAPAEVVRSIKSAAAENKVKRTLFGEKSSFWSHRIDLEGMANEKTRRVCSEYS